MWKGARSAISRLCRIRAANASGGLGRDADHARRAPMLTINGLTVRLGGRTILDRATASLPGKSRTGLIGRNGARSEEQTSEIQSLMRISSAVFCLLTTHKLLYTANTR